MDFEFDNTLYPGEGWAVGGGACHHVRLHGSGTAQPVHIKADGIGSPGAVPFSAGMVLCSSPQVGAWERTEPFTNDSQGREGGITGLLVLHSEPGQLPPAPTL